MMVWRPGLVLFALLFLVAPRELSYAQSMTPFPVTDCEVWSSGSGVAKQS